MRYLIHLGLIQQNIIDGVAWTVNIFHSSEVYEV